MCTGIEIAMLAAAAAGTATTLYAQDTQANQAEANADFQSAQAEADASAAKAEAVLEAERIREKGEQQRSKAVAAAAASGIDVSSPTAIKIDDTITHNAEEDAVLTILQGTDRAKRLNQQADADRIAGDNAADAGRINQVSTLLSAAATYGTNNGKGWKKAPGSD